MMKDNIFNIEKLTTEQQNPNSMQIDEVPTLEMVSIINKEDQKVAFAVEEELPLISKAIDEISKKFADGARLIYCGAGTSGRLGALDAVELEPTYSVPSTRAFALLAGGKQAMFEAIEGAEDSKELAITALKNVNLTSKDVIIAIAASGKTPYGISAIEYGNKIGALTISITCNKNSEMDRLAAIGIAPMVGPEVITGSTRMKSGTAQKMVLNMISTGVMIKCGKVYHNLMTSVQPTNEKLNIRAKNIIVKAANVSEKIAHAAFEQADKDVSVAIVMIKTKSNAAVARKLLNETNGHIKAAIQKGYNNK